MTLSVQFTTMFAMLLSGVYLGMVRDTYLYFEKYWKERIALTYMMEISFWLSQTFILYLVLFLLNNGELRIYVFLACFLGFATYQAMIASWYQKLLQGIIRIISSVARVIKKTIYFSIVKPILWIIRFLIGMGFGLLQFLFILLTWAIRIVLIPIQLLFRGIDALLPQEIKKMLYKLAGIYSRIENIYTSIKKFLASKRRK